MIKRKAVSIKDVARESGASLTTVSLVLNKRDRRISPATRERILAAVDRLGYRPSRLAQGLQSQRSGFIAILVPQLRHAFADAYFGELISAIHDQASSEGYKVLLEVAHPAFIESDQHLELFDRHFVDGILCIGVTNKDKYLKDFADGSRPIVIVNNTMPDHKLNHVLCDYHQAGVLAAQYLLGLGHRNFALIHGAAEVQTTWDLRRGLETTLLKAGTALDARHAYDGLYTEEGGAAAVEEMLRINGGVTAVVAGNDKMAIGAISALKAAGRRVPEDVSVVGCDDIHQAEFCDPPLTTVHTPIYDVGLRACGQLLALINGEISEVSETHPVCMAVRKSAGPPPTSA